PPDSFTLRDLGARLGELLESDPKFASDPLLAELARLEWCFVDAFDAADAPPLDPASIAAASEDDWPRARVALHPSVPRIAVRFCRRLVPHRGRVLSVRLGRRALGVEVERVVGPRLEALAAHREVNALDDALDARRDVGVVDVALRVVDADLGDGAGVVDLP